MKLSTYQSIIYSSIYLSINPSIYLSLCLSIFLSIQVSIFLFIYQSISALVYLKTILLSISLSIYLSIYLSAFKLFAFGTYLSSCPLTSIHPSLPIGLRLVGTLMRQSVFSTLFTNWSEWHRECGFGINKARLATEWVSMIKGEAFRTDLGGFRHICEACYVIYSEASVVPRCRSTL